MNSALWAAKTGLDAQQTRMSVISHNLANVNTTGFKKARAVFEDLLYQNVNQLGARHPRTRWRRPGCPSAPVCARGHGKNFTQGNLQTPATPLDVAINGRGFFQILMPDGSSGYTRDGSFKMSAKANWSRPAATTCSRASPFPPARRASPSAPTASSVRSWPGSRPDADRHAAIDGFRESRRPAAAR